MATTESTQDNANSVEQHDDSTAFVLRGRGPCTSHHVNTDGYGTVATSHETEGHVETCYSIEEILSEFTKQRRGKPTIIETMTHHPLHKLRTMVNEELSTVQCEVTHTQFDEWDVHFDADVRVWLDFLTRLRSPLEDAKALQERECFGRGLDSAMTELVRRDDDPLDD